MGGARESRLCITFPNLALLASRARRAPRYQPASFLTRLITAFMRVEGRSIQAIISPFLDIVPVIATCDPGINRRQ